MSRDVDAAIRGWREQTIPAAGEPDSLLAYRWFGSVRAVVEAESDYLVLMRIETDPASRGRGEASQALEWLKTLCDRHGVTLLGQANVDEAGGLEQTALLDWYARHGFEIDTSRRGRPLVWYPRRPAPAD